MIGEDKGERKSEERGVGEQSAVKQKKKGEKKLLVEANRDEGHFLAYNTVTITALIRRR